VSYSTEGVPFGLGSLKWDQHVGYVEKQVALRATLRLAEIGKPKGCLTHRMCETTDNWIQL